MATFSEIKEVRLRVDDPDGFIDIQDVTGDLPGSPVNQTAYRHEGLYKYHDGNEWVTLNLYVSDTRLGVWYDANGEDYACMKAIEQIITKLGKEIRLKRSDVGAESTEWTGLQDLLRYYEKLLATFQEDYKETVNKAGPRWGGSSAPEISGGNV